MSKKFSLTSQAVFLFKNLLFSYAITAILLFITAFVLYRFHPGVKTVSLCITCIYVIATFLAGFLAGKKEGVRKFLWGMVSGMLYFIILALLSLIFKQDSASMGGNFFSVMILCTAAGMLGGMVS